MESIKLNNGLDCPFIGIGTFMLTPADAQNSVREALKMGFIAPMALMAIPEEKRPVSCLHCQSCEQVCPQQIHISDFMTDFVEKIG